MWEDGRNEREGRVCRPEELSGGSCSPAGHGSEKKRKGWKLNLVQD